MMDRDIFERNLLSLSTSDSQLCTQLTRASTSQEHYRFSLSRSGLVVPCIVDSQGRSTPLQSIMDPAREAERLVSTLSGPLFLVILGLAGGDLVEAALDHGGISGILVIEFGIDGLAELFASRSYHRIIQSPRVKILVDPDDSQIRSYLESNYRPAFSGGLSVLPIRQRVACDPVLFQGASDAVRTSLSSMSKDYSVQAHFGRRWFANTLRNLPRAGSVVAPLPSPREVIIAAAGPSLDRAMEIITRRSRRSFLLATDTALGALNGMGIVPDGVISIDCQHISYMHFMEALPPSTRLFLDLASPPLLAERVDSPFFIASAHPLARYICAYWRTFPLVDSSGGNVTHAAVSLALQLGAEEIDIYGADYGYPSGLSYARGTYIHRLFGLKQDRLSSLESCFTRFLFRDSSTRIERKGNSWRYTTDTLNSYRKALEASYRGSRAIIRLNGTALTAHNTQKGEPSRIEPLTLKGPGAPRCSSELFLEEYYRKITGLPLLEGPLPEYMAALDSSQLEVFTTLLPLAASLRREKATISASLLFTLLIKEAEQILKTLL